MKQYPFLNLALANEPYADELKAAACAVIDSGRFLHGEQTARLEAEVAALCGAPHCVAVSNGLDALRLIIRAYKELGRLHDGDEVIVPANTYVASVLAVSDNGLRPVLCEPREDTMNIDSERMAVLITPRTRAIMPVHLYGTPCWDEQMATLARQYSLLVIEDNAQAIDAAAHCDGLFGSRMTGGLGHAAGLSFYPTKNLGALGDAGAVVTHDPQLAATVRAIANYGSDRRYHNVYQGLNCRIDEMQAAMLRVKLAHLHRETERRNAVARAYTEAISHPLITTPAWIAGTTQVWHQYVIRVSGEGCRDRLRDELQRRGVMTDVHYATPPHMQPCYSHLRHQHLPLTTTLADEVVSLPIAHPITPDDAREIAAIINDIAL